MELTNQFLNIDDEELWLLYADAELELKNRGLVRTRNIVGERGEFLTIKTYNSISGLPKLQAAPEGTRNVDALSRNGKDTVSKRFLNLVPRLEFFYGCGDNRDEIIEKKFEYVVIVQISKNYKPKIILELTWEQFLKYRKWHSTMRAWNLSLTKNLVNDARIIFSSLE